MKSKMKRIWLFAIMICVTLNTYAYDALINGIYYNFSGANAEVTSGGNKYSGVIAIPTSVTYNGYSYSVTSIGGYAFYNCSGLTSVTIPESVTSIGYEAFYGCSGLTSVTIPESVTSIGDWVFGSCSGLTSVTINSNAVASKSYTYNSNLSNIFGSQVKEYVFGKEVKSIGGYACFRCRGLTSVIIGNGLTSIGDWAFEGCSGLTSVTIPESVTSIASYAFSGCSGLTSVIIGNGVTSIGGSAFSGCSGLTSVTIGNSVTSIGSSAFYGCSGLTSVTINSNAVASESYKSNSNLSNIFGSQVKEYVFGKEVKSIGGYACYGCSGLTSVVIPESVTSIGNYAFYGCSGLTSVTIGNSVTSIGYDAFYGCSGLTSVTIPNSVTWIGGSAFSGCSGLTKAEFASIESLCSISFGYNSNPLSYAHHLYIDGKEVTDLVIPESVTSIGDDAFSGCSGLTSVTIGNSVTSIGDDAFSGCSGLTSVTIGNSVTSIGYEAFYGCSGLTSVTIGNGVTSIGSDAFLNCNRLTKAEFASIESLCSISFSGSSSNPLSYAHHLYIDGKEVTDLVIPESVTWIASYAFSGCSGLTSVTIGNGVTSIGIYAFEDCSGLTSVTIPESVTSIGGGTFRGCSGLTSVTIGNGVTSIGGSAFSGCSGLTSVTIPESVTSIGYEAFRGCSGLTSVAINSNAVASKSYTYNSNLSNIFGSQVKEYVFGKEVKSIGGYACYGCSGLTSVIIGNGVTSIGSWAFYNCSGLTSVTIPEGVTSIGDRAFYGCSGLTSVTIGNSVTSIGGSAFSGCSGLTSVNLPDNIMSIGASAFSGKVSLYVNRGTKTLFALWEKGYTPIEYETEMKLVPFVQLSKTASSMVIAWPYIDGPSVTKKIITLNESSVDGDSLYLTGLRPSCSYPVTYKITVDDKYEYTKTFNFSTDALRFTNAQPKVISEGNVIVASTSNLDEEETNVGFEWRRTDWTSDFQSNVAGAYLYEGTMEGYIRNMNINYLWKFRPYYEANDGSRFYGDWLGIDPTNTSYFEPTVHTYAKIEVNGNAAKVKGYAMRGSDNITSQGFMYWRNASSTSVARMVPASAVTVEAKGQVMTSELKGLDYQTAYRIVAYVTTSEGETFYGEEQTFTTGKNPTGIEDLTADGEQETTPEGIYDLNGRKLARMQKGINIVRKADGTTKKVLIK